MKTLLETPITPENETALRPFFNATPASLDAAHVVTARGFTPDRLQGLFEATDALRAGAHDLDFRRELAGRHVGRQLCSLFYEPSTRTRLSFETAAVKMGMGVVSTENAREFSSAAKGETIEDTVQVLNEYDFDAIVLRHHETGAAARAAAVSEVPILNAGDGKGEHPTQALLDAYTIYENHRQLDGMKVVLGGDLKHGRTVRSLAQLLSRFRGNHFSFVSVPELQMGEDVKQEVSRAGATFEETDDMAEAFRDADVVYWTRLQKERLEGEHTEEELARITGRFTITAASLEHLPEHAIVMHPLPRVDEISTDVDSDPRAVYFRQAGNGLYVRMALLDDVLSEA
jgi:aspartate carbamoyltransferase catalytic subunit